MSVSMIFEPNAVNRDRRIKSPPFLVAGVAAILVHAVKTNQVPSSLPFQGIAQ
jgi:hypothetical protein